MIRYPPVTHGTQKNRKTRQDFIWDAGPSAIEIITKGEFNTDPDTIKTDKLIQLFREYYMTKRNTLHITAAEISSGPNKKKMKRPRNIGKN